MPYLYLICTLFLSSGSGILGSFYNRKTVGKRDATALYNFLICSASFLGWVTLFLTDISFDARVIPYGLGFGISYALCMIGLINALRTGPISLTTLFLNLSLIATVIWGFFFWGTEPTVLVAIGLVLVIIALWLCLYTGRSNDGGKFSLKWLFYVALAFIGNSGCAIIQKTQQIHFDGKHGKLLMMCGLFFASLFCLVLYLRSDKSDSKAILKKGLVAFPVADGLLNTLHNLIIIILATSDLSPSIIYPAIAIGGLSITCIFSLIVFKEKLKWWQWTGIAVGALAVVLLSI